ncbi:Sec23-binding domain of Sec16-domain-containing protein [Suillus placidus]|uniref:Protein transport protein sec16 n=1 Tax=Suillus placidus TaxID=48579 RepID=A0A9P7A6C6_9AGAM|nr:Sec23-binding domain of Sec16-domain-containing protein [Suillus placidus]
MSTVEAAASLFGSDGDSGPDPFAVIGHEETDTTPPAGLTVHEHGQHDSTSYPSDMGQDASSLFAEDHIPQGAQPFEQDPWSVAVDQDASVPVNQIPDSSQYSAAGYEKSQGWSSAPGYSTAQPQASYVQPPAQGGHNASGAASAYYQYTPDSNVNSSQYGGSQYPSQLYAPVHGSYDHYKPTANIAPARASQPPAAPADSQTTYEPYNPMTRSVSQPYSSSAYAAAPKPASPSIPPPPAQVPPAMSAASYRPQKSNAYDPPLPPPKVSKRAVSARAPALGQYASYGQPSQVPPVPAVPPTLPAPSDNARYGSLSGSVAQPPSSHAPPRAQLTRQLTDALGIASPPKFPQQLPQPPVSNHYAQHGVSHAGSHTSPLAAPPLHADPPTPPQNSYTQELLDEALTPKQGSSSSFTDVIQCVVSPTTETHPLTSHDLHSESRAYTSDDMPWDDPESLQTEAVEATSSSFHAVQDPYTPSLPAEHGGLNGSTQPHSRPPSSPPRGKVHQHQDTMMLRGPALRRSPSHSRDGSNGSNASSLRSPVKRVSSPLRNAFNSSEQDMYPSPPHPASAYELSHYAASNGATSPSSVHSFTSHAGSVKSAYNSTASTAVNHYEPRSHATYERTSSPAFHHPRQASPAPDPYALTKDVVALAQPEYRDRSGSNGSLHSTASMPMGIPPQREVNGFVPKPRPGEPSSYGAVSAYSQEVFISPAVRPPYAPSPSLLGSNDPLGRTSTRAPVISFGFGGKMVTCFHSSPDLITGYDVALSSRHSTDVRLRVLHKLLPEFALEPSAATYPGPLFSDPGTPVSIVRTGASSQVKTKKARVVKYLEDRIEELSRGTTYMSDGTEKQRSEGKLVLVKLLKIMVENDGALSGSTHIDSAVRTALLPRIVTSEDGEISTPGFASCMPNHLGTMSGFNGGHPGTSETPISVSVLLPSALDKIQEFLVRGERRQAYHYALDEKLWAHAMVIASSIDKEAWKDVVNEFLKGELGVHNAQRMAFVGRGKEQVPPPSNGREWLRVVYSLFSGQGPTAVQEMIPASLLARTATLQVPTPAIVHTTPMSPSFPSPAMAEQIPANALSRWPELVASMISSPLSPEWSATLTALGDYLVSHQQVEAAHVCYLLSPQTSPIGGIGSPSGRIVLIGSQNPHTWPSFYKDTDPIILSEIAEFAFSLKSVTKGQEPFHGLPHLQAYKLIRASYLAEIGEIQAASRYCEAITAAMTHPSLYLNSVLIEQLKGLADRLIGTPQMAKSGSWIGGKVNKPSLDSIGSWLEGRLTKFIAGEGDEPSPPPAPSKSQVSSLGPFSHFSEISSTTTSASPSPPPGVMNQYSMSGVPPPRRSGSAMAVSTSHSHVPIDRASSAMDYYHTTRKPSPAPPLTAPLHPPRSAYPYSAHGSGMNGHSATNGYAPAYGTEPLSRKPSLEMTAEEGSEQQQQETGWWSSLNNSDSGPTPTTATFHSVDHFQASSDGLISLMDDPALAAAPSPSMSNRQPQPSFEDEDEDLGFGNNANRRERRQEATESGSSQKSVTPVEDVKKTEEKKDTNPPATASAAPNSWLGRFWKRSETAPGPIKASLGQESAFYYDKDLKRWVNKKTCQAGAETTQSAAPPPPPSRAQTASPARASAPLPHANGASSASPPVRSASAIDLSISPTC